MAKSGLDCWKCGHGLLESDTSCRKCSEPAQASVAYITGHAAAQQEAAQVIANLKKVIREAHAFADAASETVGINRLSWLWARLAKHLKKHY